MKTINVLTHEIAKSTILLFLVVISIPAVAQDHKSDDFIPQLTLSIGGSMQKFDGINDRISKLSQYEPDDRKQFFKQ